MALFIEQQTNLSRASLANVSNFQSANTIIFRSFVHQAIIRISDYETKKKLKKKRIEFLRTNEY